MGKNHLICKNQFGFRPKHSTQHAVISLVNNITNSLDSSDIVIGLFLDVKKAFDTKYEIFYFSNMIKNKWQKK